MVTSFFTKNMNFIFKGEIIDWDDNEGLKFFRFDDGVELQIPKENIQSAKLYID